MNGLDQTTHQWSRLTRFSFRFVFVYFIIYLLPFPLDGIPKLDIAAEIYNDVWVKAVPWVGRHLLRLENEITDLPSGSGDTTFSYVKLLCVAVMALLVASAWSIFDSRRTAYPRLHDWLRIYIRFALGLSMFSYGIAKVINSQFPYPDLDRFIQPIGHASPMGLLWTFMGASPAYCVFTGLAECAGGLLLFWWRTTTIGALIVAGVMINVVMLNFCYDVPVKLYSTHLLLLSIFLLLPDLHRMTQLFLLNHATTPRTLGRPFAHRWLNRSALAFKLVFLGLTMAYLTKNTLDTLKTNGRNIARPALYGLYEVESFARGSDFSAPDSEDEKRWRRVVINRAGRLAVQLLDETVQRFQTVDNAAEGKLELTPRWEPDKKTVLSYQKRDDDRLWLEGDFFGDTLQVTLHRIPDPQFLLVNRGFHWINEQPFNR